MQSTSRLNYFHLVINSVKSRLVHATAYTRYLLTNETTQKILLFAVIMGLLFLAANLDNIM